MTPKCFSFFFCIWVSKMRMRSSLVVRASDCQCTRCNGPGFNPSIRRHSRIWGAADEAVLNIVRKKKKKIPPKIFLKKRVSKMLRISRWFQIRGNNWKKMHPEKVICQKPLQVHGIEEDKLQFFILFLRITSLLATISHFSQQFRYQRKILRCFDTHNQILRKKQFLGHISTFFKL